MNILVTGATGFLGGVTARRLVQAGHTVTGLGRDVTQGRLLEQAGVRFFAANLRRTPDWEHVLDGQDAVIHAAARSTLWGKWDDFERDNVLVSREMARACAVRGLRLVHISTPSIYNATGRTDGVREDTPVGPNFDSLYARSKYVAELEVQAQLPGAAILRPRGIYGVGDTSILPQVARVLRSGRLPRLTRHEVQTELTHVENVAHACKLAVECHAAGPYNVTDGVTTSIWATLDRVADHLGVPRPQRYVPAALVEAGAGVMERLARLHPAQPEPPVTAASIRLLTRPMTLDLSRARENLGYSPIRHPSEALGEAIGALR